MRILIANPFGIGDVLFTLPLLQAIRRQDPQGWIGYLGNRRTAEWIVSWPEVDWQIPFEFRAIFKCSRIQGWMEFRKNAREIREQGFDLLLDLSLGWPAGCAAWLAGIPRRVGLDYRKRGRFLTERVPFSGFKNQPVADYYLDLLPDIGFQRPKKPAFRMSLSGEPNRNLPDGKPFLGLVPGGGASWGASARFKQWPPARFVRLADHLAKRHGFDVLLFGDQEERPICEEVAAAMTRRPTVIAPAPSILALARELKRCALVVGNDSGPMHLAAAIGVKTVAIFGPVDASVYGPPAGEGPSLRRVAARALACRPCYQDFRFPACPWDNACLKQLEPEQVIQATEELLAGTK